MGRWQLLNELPKSVQNPLLESGQFFKYCNPRFKNIGTNDSDFAWLLKDYMKRGVTKPETYLKPKIALAS
jgi:hypothetical protein